MDINRRAFFARMSGWLAALPLADRFALQPDGVEQAWAQWSRVAYDADQAGIHFVSSYYPHRPGTRLLTRHD